jgi:YHS domain-containing protein
LAAINKQQKSKNMKLKRHILTAVLLTGLAAGTLSVRAQDTNSPSISTNAPVKPYPLDYCIVSGDKLDGDMGKPIVMDYKGQEIKFCCASCPKKFKKDPDTYMKKLADAEAKAAEKK